ncbi:MAG: DTW domain-containing protein, partial [Alphaproteobacteria bacterium]|nr:DTW domain-containing protein [Alphaproteobacteria bacterium]
CVCEANAPFETRTKVLILRHPQEQDRDLGTAPLLAAQLHSAVLKTGLSWPNLAKLLGHPADPKRWGVLYLGTQKSSAGKLARIITVVDRKGEALPKQDELLAALEGVILLDGNWQQAKALWWRNAWMLKCRRLILTPPRPSHYGNLRKEPRRESVSTIEAAAWTLAELEHDPGLPDRLLPPFHALLEKLRARDTAQRQTRKPKVDEA